MRLRVRPARPRAADAALAIPADMTTISLELTVGRLSRDISCALCKASFHVRLGEVISAWGSVPVRHLATSVARAVADGGRDVAVHLTDDLDFPSGSGLTHPWYALRLFP